MPFPPRSTLGYPSGSRAFSGDLVARRSSTLRPVPSKLLEQIAFAEGIDKAKSFLVFTMRSHHYGFETMSYADSHISSIDNQAGRLTIFISWFPTCV